ncbi:MAG: hypothetical protein MK132_22830, partial [Lentisphaerales bacterium]|nr:hypothetical protein [Lentisphaerales bacterium]
MKRRNLKYFTLIELLFVIAILVVLIGISWVAGTKVLRSQTKAKTKAEITLLVSAVEQYKDRWGHYPYSNGYAGPLNFGEQLSKVAPNGSWKKSDGTAGTRPMFIDYDSSDIIVSNSDYSASSAAATTVHDPYETAYFYQHNATDNTILIYSYGLDGASTNPSKHDDDYEPDHSSGKNEDNVTSDNL